MLNQPGKLQPLSLNDRCTPAEGIFKYRPLDVDGVCGGKVVSYVKIARSVKVKQKYADVSVKVSLNLEDVQGSSGTLLVE